MHARTLAAPLFWLLHTATWLLPVMLIVTHVSARYRVRRMLSLATNLHRAHTTLQQAQTMCKMRVALALGFMPHGGTSGKLPVKILEKSAQ